MRSRLLSFAFASTVLALSATAQVPCGSGTGPDVIVGNLTGVMNVSALNGIDAVSMGTTSCNVGSAVVNWIANTNDHR
jgi:hypothetical protein